MLLVNRLDEKYPSENANSIMKRLNIDESFYVSVENEESYNALMLIFETSNVKWASGLKATSLRRNYSWFENGTEKYCVFVEYSNIDKEHVLWDVIQENESYYSDRLIHFNKGD